MTYLIIPAGLRLEEQQCIMWRMLCQYKQSCLAASNLMPSGSCLPEELSHLFFSCSVLVSFPSSGGYSSLSNSISVHLPSFGGGDWLLGIHPQSLICRSAACYFSFLVSIVSVLQVTSQSAVQHHKLASPTDLVLTVNSTHFGHPLVIKQADVIMSM